MNYEEAFVNFAKAANVPVTEKKPTVEDALTIGRLASRASAKVKDQKEHFPVITQAQAQSSMTRVLQLTEVPAWYQGTLAELRKDVHDGIIALHPDIQFNVKVTLDQAVALSDGQTPAETSVQSIKDPADVVKTEVKQVERPTLTSANIVESLADEATRAACVANLMESIDSKLAHVTDLKKLATRLLKKGLTVEEFAALEEYVQQEIVYSLSHNCAKAAASDRRAELLDRMNKSNGN